MEAAQVVAVTALSHVPAHLRKHFIIIDKDGFVSIGHPSLLASRKMADFEVLPNTLAAFEA